MITIALATMEKQLNLSTAHPLVSLPAVTPAIGVVADVQRMAHLATAATGLPLWTLTSATVDSDLLNEIFRPDVSVHFAPRVGGLMPEPPNVGRFITTLLLPSCRRPAVQ
jgi:hypothetical protein